MIKAIQGGDDAAFNEMTAKFNTWPVDFRHELQRGLKAVGVYNGAIDGEFGPSTKRALESLRQRAN